MGASGRSLGELGCRIGRHIPWWTQGPGGNVSRKNGGQLAVKATGFRLDEMDADGGVASLDLPQLVSHLHRLADQAVAGSAHGEACEERPASSYRAALAACQLAGSPRPSMEAGLHAVLPGRDVMHLHAIAAILLGEMARTDPAAVVERFAAVGLRVAVLPPLLPGWQLCEAIARVPPCEALLLQNHGLVLHGEAEDVFRAYVALEEAMLADNEALAAFAGAARGAGFDVSDARWHGPALAHPKLPDEAVFWPRLLAITEPCSGQPAWDGAAPVGDGAWRRMDVGRAAGDRDAAELWAAKVALEAVAPTLPPLPQSFCAAVRGMPEEHHRLARARARLEASS